MSHEEEDEFEQTVRGMRALAESGSHGDSAMLLKTSRGIDRLKDIQGHHTTQLALLEQRLNEVNARTSHDKLAWVAQKEIEGVAKDVSRIEKWLYAVAAAVGMEGLHMLVQLLGGKGS